MDPLQLALQVALGLLIGLSLGLLGGGGSILTVPALVYLIGQTPQAAVPTSLAIVGLNSVFGAAFHRRGGAFNARVALIFGGAGMLTAYLAAGLSRNIPPAVLMTLFAILMLVVGAIMLLRRTPADQPDIPPVQSFGPRRLASVLAAGAVVGALTGLLGVGGGFLIVPALVMLVGLPVSQAVGTSLAIIAANSLAGLLGHLGSPLDYGLMAVFVLAGLAGTLTGTRLAHRLPARLLRQIFASFVILLALFLLADQLKTWMA